MRLIFLLMFLSVACSRGGGSYRGVATDVAWEGYVVKSCEVVFKTSEQASQSQSASSSDKGVCNFIQDTIGRPIVVKYRHKFPSWFTSSNYIIEDINLVR